MYYNGEEYLIRFTDGSHDHITPNEVDQAITLNMKVSK